MREILFAHNQDGPEWVKKAISFNLKFHLGIKDEEISEKIHQIYLNMGFECNRGQSNNHRTDLISTSTPLRLEPWQEQGYDCYEDYAYDLWK